MSVEFNTPALEAFGAAIAIDSSLGTSVAVSDGTRIVTVAVDDHLRHAEVVATLIEQALSDAHVAASDIEAVVVGIGPGPFTGLRVGIAAAHGFAAGRRLSPHSLVSHEAVAYEAFASDADRAEAFVVTDARRKEFFATRYARPSTNGLPILLDAPRLFARTELGEAAESQDTTRIDPARVPAGALIELAALRVAAKQAFESSAPRYLRSPDVTPQNAPKRVSS